MELHAQIEEEMAAGAEEQQAAAGAAGAGEQAAAAAAASTGAGGSSSAASSSRACPVELATVRRMIEGIFSTSHTVYQRVQVRAGRARDRTAACKEVHVAAVQLRNLLAAVQADG